LELLIDSSSYLRIARNIHPLLGQPFGPSEYKLFIHPYFDDEYNKNSRLISKFTWVNESDYRGNRQKFHIKFANHQGNEIIKIYSFINAFKHKRRSSISDVDIFALSTAKVLDISLITDDPDMFATAEEFEIICLKTIEFLSYLHINKIVDDIKLLEIFDYWEYDNDPPKGYHSDRNKYFPHLNRPSQIFN
jgi:hypothetical protein